MQEAAEGDQQDQQGPRPVRLSPAGQLALGMLGIGAIVALVWWVLPPEAVLAPLWTQLLGWPAVLLGRSTSVQRWIGSGRLENRVWLRALLGGALFAAVLAPTGMSFLFPLFAVLVSSVHLQWSGSSAWRACLSTTVAITGLLQLIVHLGGQPTLLSGAPGWMATGTALAASVATTVNIALLAAQRETGYADLEAERRRHHEQLLHTATHDTLTEALNRTGLRRAYQDLIDNTASDHGATSTSARAVAHESAAMPMRPPAPRDVPFAAEPEQPIVGRSEAQRPDDSHQSEGTHGAPRVAVIFIDLDRFKPVNDQYGHAAGDLLLRLVAQRLTALLRPTDHLARLGGDEFVAVLADADPGIVDLVATRVASTLQTPFDLGTAVVSISASVGTAVSKHPSTTLEDLLHEADAAMYRAKAPQHHRHNDNERPPSL